MEPVFSSPAHLTAIGSYVPSATLSNEDLQHFVDTTDEWIIRRTGIKIRHRISPEEKTSHLAIAAAKDLFQRFPQKKAAEVDGIIVATTTADAPFPSVASQVQQAISATRALTLDISAACSGFVTGLQMAGGLIATGAYKKILVIGAETLTRITNYSDRSTCVLFGDGAGTVLLEAREQGAILAVNATTDGAGGKHIHLGENGKIVQNGREVYRWVLSTVPEGIMNLLNQAKRTPKDLDWIVPHSANLRIVEAICDRLSIPQTKALQSIVSNGNTSAASIPLALDMGYKEGKLKPEQLVALYAFGSGLAQAGILLKWTL